MKDEGWKMDDGGLEDRRARGLEDETGLAGGKMNEVSVNARPRADEAIKVETSRRVLLLSCP
jgi:hypothetical protein